MQNDKLIQWPMAKWWQKTFNPWIGCKKVSPACDNCYARAIMRYLVTLVAPPGSVVMDPFMGSGSTGVACVQTGHGFIGIEKEKEYFEIAKKRISEHKKGE